ncbi:hypothetical protein AURANDRAFT_67296 [Aureococcus anophagefferens]|uniref:Uncharacterized protein n=1 Tax=Aureococcus anophagefferens TaxID=44056 RepID=F0YKP1_AURAN|nr:hypothetical protein AURANDRAFT_67296 [Aureococcus anophagefferens]EGB04268.1 hypothetical protein AURANDRAFT_67296 [Aureococcus anophagefferens]|eukprot:XP_009040978.1 hypothetical protein AURANDRAFT_67296 [Aureococcus anophagefferens]
MSSEEVAELLFTPFIVPYWRRQLGMSRMTWFHYTTIALASNIESRSDKKVGVTEQKIVTPTFMDSGSVDCCPQMEPPAKKPRLPHPKGDPEVAAQNKEIQAQRKVAARKISRQAERNEAHMQKFSLPADGFYLHKLDECVVKDAVASYDKVKEGFAEKKRRNGWTTYFGTDTTAQAKRSGRWMNAKLKLKLSTHANLSNITGTGYYDAIWSSPPCEKFSHLRRSWIGRKLKAFGDVPVTPEMLNEDMVQQQRKSAP